MRISTSMKALAIAAGLLLTANAAEAKLVKPTTYTSSVVIGKVYYAGAKDANNKNYLNGRYIELYNISTDTLDISGMYIGLVESDAKANAWTAERLTEAHKDSVALKYEPSSRRCLRRGDTDTRHQDRRADKDFLLRQGKG